MAIATGTIEERCNIGSHLRLSVNRLRFVHGRVSARRSNGLNTNDEDYEKNGNDLQNSAHDQVYSAAGVSINRLILARSAGSASSSRIRLRIGSENRPYF